MGFTGIPASAFDFYARLEADNTKSFWTANKEVHRSLVRDTMVALGDELADFGPFHVFRPYNDLRFAKHKPPYKTAQGMYGESDGGAGHYVQISAEALMTGAGYYAMAKDQLERFRAAVDAEATGAEIEAIAAGLSAAGYEIGAISELKTAPRGYPKDHRRIALLRRKGLMASRSWPQAAWMHRPGAAGRIRRAWEDAAPLCGWLDTHVGPSTLPPPEFGR
ncbi:MAG: DUF2461 domain-containing protein [Desertimonas sp.]